MKIVFMTHDLSCTVGSLIRAAQRYPQSWSFPLKAGSVPIPRDLRDLSIAAMAFGIQLAIEQDTADPAHLRQLEQQSIAWLESGMGLVLMTDALSRTVRDLIAAAVPYPQGDPLQDPIRARDLMIAAVVFASQLAVDEAGAHPDEMRVIAQKTTAWLEDWLEVAPPPRTPEGDQKEIR